MTSAPNLLKALDHVATVHDGWIADCPHFECGGMLLITAGETDWQLQCDAGCTHDELVHYLQCDTRISPVSADRAYRALMLSPTPEVWAQLLKGNDVPADQLDQDELRRIRSRRLA